MFIISFQWQHVYITIYKIYISNKLYKYISNSQCAGCTVLVQGCCLGFVSKLETREKYFIVNNNKSTLIKNTLYNFLLKLFHTNSSNCIVIIWNVDFTIRNIMYNLFLLVYVLYKSWYACSSYTDFLRCIFFFT